jgi:hypothetical protein
MREILPGARGSSTESFGFRVSSFELWKISAAENSKPETRNLKLFWGIALCPLRAAR